MQKPIPTTEFLGFDSRRLTMDEIMKNLENDEINLIGICGMGGIGKTTMVKEVANKIRENNKFHDMSFVVVKQQQDMRQIQKDIAETLGLKLEQNNLRVRADLLRHRLSAVKDNKRILIILDDVWEQFNLNDVGIPLVSGCKILYTSRNRDMWNDVRTKKEIHIGLLREEEAWQLFREKAGDSADDPELQPIAKQIVNECGRLPLALVTIGSVLNNSIKHKWEDVLLRLQMPQSRSNLSGVPAEVYKSLELSYNYLKDDEAKHLFLLCCLVEEDYDIPIEDLARYGMGLSLFEGINDLAKIRNRVFALVDHLKSRHLLLDGKRDECVKVHVVMRDVGILIASKDKGALVSHGIISEWPKKSTYEDYTSISLVISKEIAELPEGLRCPKLELLLLVGRNIISPPSIFHKGSEHNKKILDNFFEEMGELKVLELRSLDIPLMPSSLGFLRNLQTLCVYSCLVNNIYVIGELLNLEILTFRYSNITELPAEIGKLANLRLLDLTGCHLLKKIPPSVISGLVRLEELYMRESGFSRWEGEGMEEGRNASLREFEFLSNLNTLEILIEIEEGAILQRIPLFSKLTKYTIIIHHSHFDYRWWGTKSFQKHLQFSLNKCIPLNREINSLLRSTESVELEGDGSNDLVRELYREGIEGLQHLKNLLLKRCNTPEHLANSTYWVLQPNIVVFPILESLYLHHLSNLREICHGQLPAGSFGKLSLLKVSSCDKLKNLFRLSIVRCLMQLKHLEIDFCNNMEEVIWNERGDVHDNAINKIEFPKLEIMKLEYLPRLTSFYRGIDEIAFPQLKELTLDNLSQNAEDNDNAALLSIFPQKVAFPSLEVLELNCLDNLEGLGYDPLSVQSFSKLIKVHVRHCGKLLNVIPSQLFAGLQNLEEITMEDCSSLEKVFKLEGEDYEEQDSKVLPSLKSLKLKNLPKLNHIPKSDSIGFTYIPQLSILHVHDLDSLRYLFSPAMIKSIPQLQELDIMRCKLISRIVAEENGQGGSSVDKIEFPQLKILRLYDMPNLVSFFPEVIDVVAASNDNLQSLMQPISKQKITFPSLEVLELKHLDKLEGLGHDIIGIMYIPRLSILHVHDCDSLRYLFSSANVKSILQLQELEIMRCKMMSRIVAVENGQGEGSVLDVIEEQGESSELDIIEFPQLKFLRLYNLPHLVSFFPMHPLFKQKIAFPSLEVLELKHLYKLEGLAIGIMHIPRLTILHVHDCHRLRYLFLPATVKSIILQLQELEIVRCKIMIRIIAEENVHVETLVEKIEFPQLKILLLYDVPNLVSFIPKVVSTVVASYERNQSPVQHFFNENVTFPSLEKLRVSYCGSFRNLLYPFMARYLVHLQELIISKCSMVEEVVSNGEDEEKGEGNVDRIWFPKLKYLELRDLPVLKSFFRVNHEWEWPLLESITVFDCPKIETLSPGILRSPNLQIVWVKWWAPNGGVEGFWTNDLNYTLRQVYSKRGSAQSPGAATVGLTRLSHPTSSPSASTSLPSAVVRSTWTRFCCG